MQKRLLFIFICFFQYDYTFAIRCNAGKYSSGSVCFNCLKGTYQPDAGATSCFQCNRGTYQSIDGSTSCLSCNAGSFQANVGQANCLACGIGTYWNVPHLKNQMNIILRHVILHQMPS